MCWMGWKRTGRGRKTAACLCMKACLEPRWKMDCSLLRSRKKKKKKEGKEKEGEGWKNNRENRKNKEILEIIEILVSTRASFSPPPHPHPFPL